MSRGIVLETSSRV